MRLYLEQRPAPRLFLGGSTITKSKAATADPLYLKPPGLRKTKGRESGTILDALEMLPGEELKKDE